MNTLENIAKLCLFILLFSLASVPFEMQAQEYEVEPVPFNGREEDFAAWRYKDGVVFCSDRTRKKLLTDEDSIHFYTDMFTSVLLPNNQWTEPKLFAPSLTDFLNEGPVTFSNDGNTMYYTANYAPTDTSRRSKMEEYKLGIFSAQWKNGEWTNKQAFPYNSSKSEFNLAHPALADNDSTLYFTSNMPGGIGGTDIYKCVWRNNRWSLPINLGATINTTHDELFPFVSEENAFYFTSNRPTSGKGNDLNIWVAQITEHSFGKPGLMPQPINSSSDDFAYTEYSGNQYGFFSSNRNGETDDIFQFRMGVPNFNDCNENFRPIYCYQIEDMKVSQADTLPLVYEWDLGDGRRKRGLSVEHCYDTLGTYHLSLNILDTLTNTVFYRVSETDIVIEEAHQPYILSNDSTVVNAPIRFYSDDHFITDFKIEKRFWIVNNREHFESDSLTYTFTEPGTHTVLCGVTGPIGPDGYRQKACSYKQIRVFEEGYPGLPQPDPDPTERPFKKIQLKSAFQLMTEIKEPSLAPLFHIVLAETKQRITFNDPFFSKTRFVIIEAQNDDGSFVYTVGNTAEINRLYPMFRELRDSGYHDLKVETFNRQELVKEFVRTGKYIAPGNADQLNKEFANLRDIKFEYNSDVILEESKANLNYIAAMLLLESDFKLKINAHTCSMGSHTYNMELSKRRAKSVMKYFTEKGINTSRLVTEGFAETMPLASNLTEEGREQNRRVEFIILFEDHTLASNEE
jgi:outer membrane protein OmpA-like peptidoglycan-associated protein